MNLALTNKFLARVGIMAFCLGLLLLASVQASAIGASGKKSGSKNAAVEDSCWERHARQVQDGILPIVVRRDSLAREIALRKRSLLTAAMDKQGIAGRLTKSQPGAGKPTPRQKADEKADEKAALEELRVLDSQIEKNPELQKSGETLRAIELTVDSAVTEILKTDPACAGMDRARRRGFASQAIHEFQARIAKKPQTPKRKAINPGQSSGESE